MRKIVYIFITFLLLKIITPLQASADDNKNVYIENNGTVIYYETLEEAISNVADNVETKIVLGKDIELSSSVTIAANKKIIIDGNNNKITYKLKADNTWYTGQLFNIKASASLSLLNVHIDGNNNYVFDYDTYELDLYNLEKVSNVLKYITPEENKPNITVAMINNAGTLYIENTTIKNFYSSSGKNLINSSAGSTTTFKNSTISHCASSGGGLVTYVTGENAKVYIEEGTIIDDNFVGSNGGILKAYTKSAIEINGGEIKNTRAVNTNGIVSMSYGAGTTITLNNGLISNNSGISGVSNGRNAAIYIHNGSKFIMNGGTIEYNIGTSAAGIDAPGHSTSNLALNGGTIQYNETTNEEYTSRSDLNIQYDYDLELGKDMVINGNVYIKGDLDNEGTINGNVTIDLSSSTTTDTIKGPGKIVGDVIIKYDGEEKPEINNEIDVTGRVVSYEVTTQAVARFEFNGGIDNEGYNYDLIAVTKEDGTLDKIPVPKKEGHTFVAWYKEKELTNIWNNEPVMSDITLYAKWEVNEYTIIWDNNGELTKEIYKFGEKIKLPNEPTRNNYLFDGWNNYIDGMTTPANDLRFTAKWLKVINPNTGDNIMKSLFWAVTSIITIILLSVKLFKLNKKKF